MNDILNGMFQLLSEHLGDKISSSCFGSLAAFLHGHQLGSQLRKGIEAHGQHLVTFGQHLVTGIGYFSISLVICVVICVSAYYVVEKNKLLSKNNRESFWAQSQSVRADQAAIEYIIRTQPSVNNAAAPATHSNGS